MVTRIYFDGGCSPNPGRMSAGIVLSDENGDRGYKMDHLGYGTNNIAEWAGLIWATMWARDMGLECVEFIGDSQLVVKQAQGAWRAKDPTLNAMREEFRELSRGMEMLIRHVPRDDNLAGRFLEFGVV